MRRIALGSLLIIALATAGCTSSSTPRETVTEYNTVTSGAAGAGSGATSGAPITVVGSTPVATTAKSTATPKPATTKSTPKATAKTTSAPAVVKVNPLNAACGGLLAPTDVARTIGAKIGNGYVQFKLAAEPKVGATGRVRCRFATTDKGLTSQVSVLLTQYNSTATAATAVRVTVASERSLGAQVSTSTAVGRPVDVLLRQGGLVVMQYDTWTLAIAVADKLATNAKLAAGLPGLEAVVLSRVLMNG